MLIQWKRLQSVPEEERLLFFQNLFQTTVQALQLHWFWEIPWPTTTSSYTLSWYRSPEMTVLSQVLATKYN